MPKRKVDKPGDGNLILATRPKYKIGDRVVANYATGPKIKTVAVVGFAKPLSEEQDDMIPYHPIYGFAEDDYPVPHLYEHFIGGLADEE